MWWILQVGTLSGFVAWGPIETIHIHNYIIVNICIYGLFPSWKTIVSYIYIYIYIFIYTYLERIYRHMITMVITHSHKYIIYTNNHYGYDHIITIVIPIVITIGIPLLYL